MGELLHPVVHGRRVSWVVYMCSSWLYMASGSRDLSQAEKRIMPSLEEKSCYVKLSKFTKSELLAQKMTTLFIQDNLEHNFVILLSFT